MAITGSNSKVAAANALLDQFAKDGKLVFPTSGSTGNAKKVTLTKAQMDARCARITTVHEDAFVNANRLYLSMSFNRSTGFRDLYWMISRGKDVVLPFDDYADSARGMAECDVARIGPAEGRNYVDLFAKLKLKKIPHLVCGGSPIARQEMQSLLASVCAEGTYSYGASECGTIATGLFSQIKDLPNCVGEVAPDLELKLNPPDNRISIKGPAVIAGYDGEKPFDDGLFWPGDIGSLQGPNGNLLCVVRA